MLRQSRAVILWRSRATPGTPGAAVSAITGDGAPGKLDVDAPAFPETTSDNIAPVVPGDDTLGTPYAHLMLQCSPEVT